MISCTEFIPLYSEFFKYLAKRGGGDGAVMEYWIHLSDTSIGDKTNPNSLAYKCEKLGGYEGARAYWGHTLTEEACDLYEIYNPKEQYTYSLMRHCPSRGMLNDLKHVEPYHNYCEHCNVIYARVLEKYGIEYERDNSEIANARCSGLYYRKGHKPNFDYTKPTPDCIVNDLKSEGAKYLHRDFHLIAENALCYCADKYGIDGVRGFLTDYARYYYAPIIDSFKKEGLPAVLAWLEKLYLVEEAPEVLHTELSECELKVRIDKSPVIEYMHTLGKEPSEYYVEETRTLYAAMAEEAGLGFSLDKYVDATGEAEYRFFLK